MTHKQINTEELVERITDFVNNMSYDQRGFLEAMSKQHRTLQQEFTRLCFKWIENCATEKYSKRTDLRNAATHGVSKDVVDAFEQRIQQKYNASSSFKPSEMLPNV